MFTTGEELDINDGDDERKRTIYFQPIPTKNTGPFKNQDMMMDFKDTEKVGTSTNRTKRWMEKQMNLTQTHAGAPAATLPLLNGFYLHDEAYVNSKTKYKLLHRHSYENQENAGDASDPRILREKVFEKIPWTMQFSKFFLFQITEMMGRQKAQSKKQKHKKTQKHALRSFQQQQLAATARMFDEGEFNEEYGPHTSEEERQNLDDGRYEKTIYVKTWTGRTITAKISPERTAEIVKMQVEAKTGIPTDNHQLVARGRVLMDNIPLKEYGSTGGETIKMTAKLLGGMKHKSLSPKPIDTEREEKERIRTVHRWERL